MILPIERTRRGIRRFIDAAYPIYKGDSNWVAPLRFDLTKVFTDANPLFEHAEMQLWLAMRNGAVVGRIAGIIDKAHNDFHKETTAFFGFFESIDDQEIADGLFSAVAEWAKQRGMSRLLGPMNPTTNDECGLLVEGFDSPPVIMMTYNPPYYARLIERAGFAKAKDLLALYVGIDAEPVGRMNRLAAGAQRRIPGIKVRSISRGTLKQDLVQVKEVYNAAWEDNWGFVPMTEGDLDFIAGRLKPLLAEDLALLVEIDGEAVGFILTIPDFNVAIRPMRGRLFTPALWNLIQHLRGKRRIKNARVITLGIKKGFRQRGIDAILFSESFRAGRQLGFAGAEVSWILEDNVMMLRSIETFGGKLYKRYRIYERPV